MLGLSVSLSFPPTTAASFIFFNIVGKIRSHGSLQNTGSLVREAEDKMKEPLI